MHKEFINPDTAWNAAPRGYSHVVKVTNPTATIFVAGQAAVDKDLNIIGTDIEAQTRATFENIKAGLEAAGATMADIVDMTVYLSDIATQQWPVRKVREEFFEPGCFPVSTMVEVSRFALEEMLIEIDVIAAV